MTWITLYQLMALWCILLVALGILLVSHRQVDGYTKAKNGNLKNPELINLFEKALINEEFILLYQPKVSVKSGKICGAEALIRWHNPEKGWILPEQFIPAAEAVGFIVPLGRWVIRKACQQAKIWQQVGHEDVRVAVNLSAQQFIHGDLVEDIARILEEEHLAAESLEVELTESIFLEHTEKNVLMLKVLKAMGVSISLDDFGTGYSSLRYLRQFPLNSLKIDRCFIENICVDPEDAHIVKAMVALAKALNMSTVAEGVETRDQMTYLSELEVDELQGYYYNRPLTAVEFMAELQKPDQHLRAPMKA